MNRSILQGFLQIGVFVGGGGFLLALAHPPDTPEFVASVCSGGIGLVLIVGAIVVSRILR